MDYFAISRACVGNACGTISTMCDVKNSPASHSFFSHLPHFFSIKMKYYLEKMCEERPTYVRLDVPRARALRVTHECCYEIVFTIIVVEFDMLLCNTRSMFMFKLPDER